MSNRTQASLAIALALGFATSGAYAAEPKYKKTTKEPTVKQTEKTQKLEAKPKKEAAPDTSITADKFINIEIAVQGDVDAVIEAYIEQLKDEADDSRRIDIGFRLAEAYAQKQRYHHSLAMEAAMKADKATG